MSKQNDLAFMAYIEALKKSDPALARKLWEIYEEKQAVKEAHRIVNLNITGAEYEALSSHDDLRDAYNDGEYWKRRNIKEGGDIDV